MLKLEPFLDGKIVSNRLFLQKERKQTSRDKEVKLTFLATRYNYMFNTKCLIRLFQNLLFLMDMEKISLCCN